MKAICVMFYTPYFPGGVLAVHRWTKTGVGVRRRSLDSALGSWKKLLGARLGVVSHHAVFVPNTILRSAMAKV